MLKQLIGAAVALFAATAWAQAADGPASGRITYIDAASRTVMVENARVDVAASATLTGLHLGAKVAVVNGQLSGPFATAAAAPLPAPAGTHTTTGHVTFVDAKAGVLMIDNVRWEMRTAMDLSRLRVGASVQVDYYRASIGRKVAQAFTALPLPTKLAALTTLPATVARAQ